MEKNKSRSLMQTVSPVTILMFLFYRNYSSSQYVETSSTLKIGHSQPGTLHFSGPNSITLFIQNGIYAEEIFRKIQPIPALWLKSLLSREAEGQIVIQIMWLKLEFQYVVWKRNYQTTGFLGMRKSCCSIVLKDHGFMKEDNTLNLTSFPRTSKIFLVQT